VSTSQLIIVALVLAAFAFFAGRARAWSVAANAGGIRSLHSLPIHHGALVALWCLLPVLLLVIGWKLIEPVYVNGLVADNVPADIAARGEQSVSLYRNEVENLAADGDVSDVSDDAKRVLGERLISQRASSRTALSLLAIALALGGAAFAYRRIAASTKARHSVEGMVMGIMIIPFVSSLSDDVITAVPQAMRDGSYALGSTQSETVRKVVIPAALPGIVGGILLAASRAIGETMIVVMAAGLAANLTANPLEAVTTVTVQIVTLLTGDQEFDSAKTLAAFALGLMLFVVTLVLNVIALYVVRRYREQYE